MAWLSTQAQFVVNEIINILKTKNIEVIFVIRPLQEMPDT